MEAGPSEFAAMQGGQDTEVDEEEDPLRERIMDTNTYLILEDYLSIKMEEVTDPILKANMQWEQRILHSANMQFLNMGMSTNISIRQLSHCLC